MPMDYDENEFNIHDVELAEEVSSTVSSVLRPYDYEDGGHLRFDSLVENEVFLGITGQEDNQWIEEYSRGASSSAAESRHNNVWSEATSSESVEMLLKSVGQEVLMTESSDEPRSLATNADSNLQEDDKKYHDQEEMVIKKKQEGALTVEEMNVSDGSIDPDLKQGDEYNPPQEAMFANKEEGCTMTIEELDVGDEPVDSNLKPDDENNNSQEALVTNKEEDEALKVEEFNLSDEPLDPNLTLDDECNHAQEAMVTNEEEGNLTVERLDVCDAHMDPNLKQDDECNNAPEATVTNKEEWALKFELDVCNESVDPNLKQDDGSKHVHEATVTNKEAGPSATGELHWSDDHGKLTTNMDHNLKQDDGKNHVQREMVTNKPQDYISGSSASFDCDGFYVMAIKASEEVALETEKFDVSNEHGSLARHTDPNLNQDDGTDHVQEVMVTNKEVEALVSEELDVSDDPVMLTTDMELNLKQDDVNNNSQEAVTTNKPAGHFLGSGASFECDDFYVMANKESQEVTLETEEFDVSDEHGNLARHMEPELNQDDGTDHAQRVLVTNKEVETLVTEELNVRDVGDERDSLAIHIDSNLKQDDGTNHAQEEIVTNIEVEAMVTEELDVSDDPGMLITNMDLNLKQCDEINHAQEATETNEEVEDLVTDALDVIDDSGMLTTNMDPNLKQDDEINNVKEATETNKEAGAMVTEDLDAGDDPVRLTANMNSNLKQDDGNNHACKADIHNESEAAELLVSNTALVATPEAHSGNSSDMDQTVAAKLSGSLQQKINDEIQSILPAEGCKAHESEADITILAEQGYTDAKSPPLLARTSPVHDDIEEKRLKGAASDEICVDESLRVASCMIDCPSVSVVETGASPDVAGEVVHVLSVENMNEQAQEANTASTVDPVPCDLSTKVDDDVDAIGSTHESNSGHHLNVPSEQPASTDDIHMTDDEHSSVSTDKLHSVSPLLNTDKAELSQSTTVKPTEGSINENISLSEATEDVLGEELSIPSNAGMKIDKSSTFEVNTTVEPEETGIGLQTYSASQACSLSMNMEVPGIDPNGITLDPRKPNEAHVATPHTPGSGTIHAGAKERKTKRKSAGKESVKKIKETTTTQLKPKVEGSVTKPAPTSNLPDLNSASCIFHQPFTNNQQVQLRAQILVYGSLISGMPPEEPHMIAAFGESAAGRKSWEAAWHACLERVHGQKPETNTPATQQLLSDLKDASHRTPDIGIKQSGTLSSSTKGTLPAVSPMSSVLSPLWNMSTPSGVGFQSRNAAYQQPFTSLHPSIYQTPPNPLWLPHASFLGQWGVASSPASATPRLSTLSRIEPVKLTPVKVSGGGSQTYSMPVVHSTDGKNTSSDLKSRKRKKVAAAVSSLPAQFLMTPPPVTNLVPDTVSHKLNRFPFLVESQTDSVTPPVVTTILSTSVTVSPSPGRFLSVHGPSRLGDEKLLNVEDMLLKRVEEGTVQEAVVNEAKTLQHPSSESRRVKRTKISTSPAVSQTPVPTSVAMSVASSSTGRLLETIHGYPKTTYQNMEKGLVVEENLSKVNESKLQAENVALLASAEVSNCQDVWSQKNSDVEAKLMLSVSAAATVSKMASAAAKIASDVAEQAKLLADEAALFRKTETSSHVSHPDVVNKATPASNSIISAAREAARRRIEAASAASKHAENLDAIVKAAELAAEAMLQVGKIVALHDSSALKKLAEAGPEGFWKLSQSATLVSGEVSGLHLNSNSGEMIVPNVLAEETQTSKHVAHNQMMMVVDDGSVKANERNTGSPHACVVDHTIHRHTSGIWEKHNIKEGCLVEVYKKDDRYNGAWLAANVLSLKDQKALVCYTGIQCSNEEELKEWVAFEVEGSEEAPRIRIAHPMTMMRFEGARKRRRTAVTDYAWSKGDRVDVWMHNCWREGVVTEPNKIDETSLTVQFPAMQGETSVVRSWHVRPTLIWKDGKWIESKAGHASQGETPKEKRMKLVSPDKLHDEEEAEGSLFPLLSSQQGGFNIGTSTGKLNSDSRPIQKERARVVFGVPKPGKKQKFMDVSTQHVDGRTSKTSTKNGPFKFSKPVGARVSKNDAMERLSKNDAMENQVAETKPRLKPRKPPVPSLRTLTSRDSVENSSNSQNQAQVGSSSNKKRDQAKGSTPKKGFSFTSKPKSEHLNKGGRAQLAPLTEVKENSNSQVNEPRRSNRKIQPTSRLLEGLQSSLTTISKIPSLSNTGQRKVNSKGNTSQGDRVSS